MYDFHIHTNNSLDSKQTVQEVCQFAIENGVEGVAFTDHVDVWFFDRENTVDRIKKCISDVNLAKEKYADKLNIYQGVEMAEYLYDAKKAQQIMELTNYDVVLGSVHSVKFEDFTDSYSRLDFSETVTSKEKTLLYLKKYFNKVMEMSKETDFDVLSHLTCPLRYINGKYGRNIDVMDFKPEIEEILKLIIGRNISLEVNTSGINTTYNTLMPDIDIIKMYYNMGGELITLGSDAHICKNIANGFSYATEQLKKISFSGYYIFENRVPRKILFK